MTMLPSPSFNSPRIDRDGLADPRAFEPMARRADGFRSETGTVRLHIQDDAFAFDVAGLDEVSITARCSDAAWPAGAKLAVETSTNGRDWYAHKDNAEIAANSASFDLNVTGVSFIRVRVKDLPSSPGGFYQTDISFNGTSTS